MGRNAPNQWCRCHRCLWRFEIFRGKFCLSEHPSLQPVTPIHDIVLEEIYQKAQILFAEFKAKTETSTKELYEIVHYKTYASELGRVTEFNQKFVEHNTILNKILDELEGLTKEKEERMRVLAKAEKLYDTLQPKAEQLP